MTHSCCPITWELGTGGFWVRCQPGLWDSASKIRIKKTIRDISQNPLGIWDSSFSYCPRVFPKPLDEPVLLSSYLFKNSQIACSIYDCALPLSGTYFKTRWKFSFCIAEIWITFFWLDRIAEAGRKIWIEWVCESSFLLSGRHTLGFFVYGKCLWHGVVFSGYSKSSHIIKRLLEVWIKSSEWSMCSK